MLSTTIAKCMTRIAIRPMMRLQSTTATLTHSDKTQRRHVPRMKKPTVEDTVTNILYNTPPTTNTPPDKYILHCLVQNESGVLSRLAGILAARNFNIESLVVARTEVPDLSRMTVLFQGQNIEQARRQLEDMVDVWAVLDYTTTPLVQRELALVKLSILGPESLHEQMPMAKLDPGAAFVEEALNKPKEDHPSTGNLRTTFSNLRALTELTRLFNGKVVDVSSDSIIVELCTKPNRVDSFIKLCRPFGILEASRTGVMVMPRAPVHDPASMEDDDKDDEADMVDASLLPPG